MNMAGVAVVIPCYKVRGKIADVLRAIPSDVSRIFCVDDACPDQSGAFIETTLNDPRVTVLKHEKNQGVGGAVLTGYRAALESGATIVVKIDGDGQMDPALIPKFVSPIAQGLCDYTKGNRFYRPESLQGMPPVRIFGNGVLSFLTKLSSGYWHIFDPTNGYTAVHADILRHLPLDKISHTYFFESDMLFRLNVLRAVVRDVPMNAVYDGEESNLKISRILRPFICGHLKNFYKRIVYAYFLRDFHIASLELVLGLIFMIFGLTFGGWHWITAAESGEVASAGTVMLSALPFLIGVQLLLSFLQFDIQSVPRTPLHPGLKDE